MLKTPRRLIMPLLITHLPLRLLPPALATAVILVHWSVWHPHSPNFSKTPSSKCGSSGCDKPLDA
jgi:hypothetical protein